ncbi:PAS domain S-box protein [Metabacillus sp. GX 13764]|uniref:PAS domain S-box protein n=1 Tax=Metabacillus kandeliae TaxID=2900151 RepID=UPI001E3C6ACF|nr:PAS domain S-box protein [Metabacillus kandeliae]MCD7036176.1 PAS domain S-box protein [Metabacillus kandeliae]
MSRILEVTEEKLTEEVERLKEENRLLARDNHLLAGKLACCSKILDESMEALFVLDESLEIIGVNQAACKVLEYSAEELEHRSFMEFVVFQDDCKMLIEQMADSIPCTKETVLKLSSGKLKFAEFSFEKHFTGKSRLLMIKDVSSKKLLEREKSMNEKLFKDLFQRAADGIVIFDGNGRFVDANSSFCNLLEIQRKDLQEYALDDFIAEKNWNMKSLFDMLLKNGKAKGELEIQLKHGQKRILEHTTAANMVNGYFMAILRDITEKRTMERKLFKSEERFREIFENAIDAIIIWEPSGRIQKANHAASRTFELPMDELLTCNVMDFIDSEDPRFFPAKKEYMKNGAIREELLFIMGNNQQKELEFTSKMNVMEGHHLTILRNVSDRKRMEKELRESEQKFRKVFNGGLDGIILFDSQCRILEANPMAISILQMEDSRETVSLFDLLSPDQSLESKQRRKTAAGKDEFSRETVLKLKDETEKILEYSVKRNINENMHLAVFKDVTERKALEERLRKSDTLSVVGELAAGIAHEIRNPMTALKGFIQLLEASVQEDFSMYFNVITSELSRIETIITEFLVLAKPQAVHYEQNSVLKIMQHTLDLLGAQSILNNVQMHLHADKDLPSIYCEPNQLKQVFINIVKNAIEVMPNGGNVTITLSRKSRNQLLIMIADEGTGIPKDKIKRLGEPFYTTKERGTGLGLMVSFKIIEEHKGKVDVKSKAGKGTVFYITLPIVQTAD